MKKLIVLAVMLLMISGCGQKSVLEELGYEKEEITLIESLGEEATTLVESLAYNPEIVDIINAEGFLKDSLGDYLKMDSSLSIEDRIMIVNKGYFYDYYDQTVLDFMKTPFYIHSRLSRYLDFYAKESMDYRDVIEHVNADRDLIPYEEWQDANVDDGYLVLCNKYNSLGKYEPEDLVGIEERYGLHSTLRYEAYENFKDMCDDMANLGLNIWATSAYRSYNKQLSNYNNYLTYDSVAEVDSYCARPGFSEHQTGLVVDVITPGGDLGSFQYSNEYQWMKDHSYEYGFILRYPEDKEDITGYVFESWHYRYVGKDVAKYIYDQDITLDEYHAYFIEK